MDSILRIRRPEDFDKMPVVQPQRPVPVLDLAALGIISTKVEDGPTKVFVGGLPKEFSEEQVKNLLLRYGKLKSFHLVKDPQGVQSRGFAFCEFADEKGVQNALKFLNGMKVGTRSINVRRTGQHPNMVTQNLMTVEEKKTFESKLDDFIYETGKLVSHVGVIDAASVTEQLEKHNETMKSYIQQQYSYYNISNVVEVKAPTLTKAFVDDHKAYQEIVLEIK